METTETPAPDLSEYTLPDLLIGQEAKAYLYTAGKWAKFLGIIGFIATGIMVLLAIFASALTSLIGAVTSSSPGLSIRAGVGILSLIPLVPIVIIYFFMSYFLYQFGVNIKSAIANNDTVFATRAFRNLKSHFKLIGIVLIVVIAFYILAFLAMIFFFGATTLHRPI